MIKTPIALATVLALLLGGGFAVAQDGKRGDMFQRLDANGDGQLTKAEVEAAANLRFANMDSNGDGLLSSAEITAGAKRGGERASKRAARMIERADANGDGLLSQTEIANARPEGKSMFDRADANGDGVLTQEEARAMRGLRGARGAQDS
ncbi:MAG: histidine kinase [Pseudomonadota bacterium]